MARKTDYRSFLDSCQRSSREVFRTFLRGEGLRDAYQRAISARDARRR